MVRRLFAIVCLMQAVSSATAENPAARYADWHHFTVEKDVHGNGFVLRLLMLLLGCFCAY